MRGPTFKIGDHVQKIGGRYGGPGRIIGITEDMGDGYRLYSVAMKVAGGYGEFVHVFPASALQHSAGPDAPTDPSDGCEDCGYFYTGREEQQRSRFRARLVEWEHRTGQAEKRAAVLEQQGRVWRRWIRGALKEQGLNCNTPIQEAWALLVAERNRLRDELARLKMTENQP